MKVRHVKVRDIRKVMVKGKRRVFKVHGKIFETLREAEQYDRYVQALKS